MRYDLAMKPLLVTLLVTLGCAAPVGTSGSVSAPRDSAPQCANICHDIGLALDSVVVMANNVGCVCAVAVPPPSPGPAPGATTSTRAGGATGGMTAIMIAQEHHSAVVPAHR